MAQTASRNCIIKEFGYELADPVCRIFNSSLTSGVDWKFANIIPIPIKAQPATCEDELRPIALTACLSKILDGFVVKWCCKISGTRLTLSYLAVKGRVDNILSYRHD